MVSSSTVNEKIIIENTKNLLLVQKLIYCGRPAIYFVIRIFAQLLETFLYFLSTRLPLANTLKNSIQFNQAINEDRNLFIITNLLEVAAISILVPLPYKCSKYQVNFFAGKMHSRSFLFRSFFFFVGVFSL